MATGQPDETTAAEAPQKKLTNLQQRFCEHYARIWKGAPAARLAGYAEGSAKQTARDLLQQGHIMATILQEAAKLGMTTEEAKVRMSEWGRVSIDDVMTLEEEEYTTRVQKPLREIVEEEYEKIQFEQELAIRTEILFTDRKEQKRYRNKQQALHLERLIKHERLLLELEKNPDATREVDGPKEKREVVRLDMVKVHKLQAGHMIKKLTPTRYGTAVELHDAKDAVTTMLKVEGAFAPVKVDHTTNGNDLPGSNIMMPDNGRD
jgi:phage terminase small subunit